MRHQTDKFCKRGSVTKSGSASNCSKAKFRLSHSDNSGSSLGDRISPSHSFFEVRGVLPIRRIVRSVTASRFNRSICTLLCSPDYLIAPRGIGRSWQGYWPPASPASRCTFRRGFEGALRLGSGLSARDVP